MLTGVWLGFATEPTATRKADAKQRANPYGMAVDCVVGYGVYTGQHFGMLNTRQYAKVNSYLYICSHFMAR